MQMPPLPIDIHFFLLISQVLWDRCSPAIALAKQNPQTTMQAAEAARLHYWGIGEGCWFGEGKQAGEAIDYNSDDGSSVGGNGGGLSAGNCITSSCFCIVISAKHEGSHGLEASTVLHKIRSRHPKSGVKGTEVLDRPIERLSIIQVYNKRQWWHKVINE